MLRRTFQSSHIYVSTPYQKSQMFKKLSTKSFKSSICQRLQSKNIRFCSTNISEPIPDIKYENLSSRSLIRLSGSDMYNYLQGLITNDINHLQTTPSLYTMFLNTKGRILYDSILYKYNDIILLECDSNDIESIIKHLKMYRVRRKIDIDNVSDVLKLGVIFQPNQSFNKNCDTNGTIKDLEQLVPCTTIYEHDSSFELEIKNIFLDKNVNVYRDPRLSSLGVRIIHSKELDISNVLKKKAIPLHIGGDDYIITRYKLGVAEGINEIPIGNSFPHEYNCDYLHGVSFHKGCYIGQELTARTQHTGVVRKRIMPLCFESNIVDNSLPNDTIIEDSDKLIKVTIGKLRGVHNNCGIGLMRIAEALKVNQLKIKNHLVKTVKPSWWPIEASKNVTKAKEMS